MLWGHVCELCSDGPVPQSLLRQNSLTEVDRTLSLNKDRVKTAGFDSETGLTEDVK